ncbi:hypothetical protein GM182_01835 [bacterium 3DAC]|nr:hypothetical protein [Dictyoglomota bacterium]UZN22676.1 hypothetical protein GM182_01835 [bacterium 3DAC]
MGFDTFLLLDLLGTIWNDKEEARNKRKHERIHLLSRVYGVHINKAEKAIEYLDEIIKRYKRHFKVPSPEHQLATVLSFLNINTREVSSIYPLWFETLLEYPPQVDYAFVSSLEKLKREKHIIISGYVGMDYEAEKYIRELLSISGFLYLFDNLLVSSSMSFIPPSPLAFAHVPPPGMFRNTIGISVDEACLKSMVLAGYKHIYIWNSDEYNGIFDSLKDYSEIITKLSIL